MHTSQTVPMDLGDKSCFYGESMSMKTVDSASQRQKMLASRASRNALRTDDISGAQAESSRVFRCMKQAQRTPFSLTTEDIGAKPAELIPKSNSNRPLDNTLNIRDIEFSHPEVHRGFRTKRCIDPLNPHYTLSSYEVSDPPPPPPGRDILRVDDIAGTTTKKRIFAEKDPLATTDIPGASSSWKQTHKKRHTPGMALDVEDINTGGIFASKREVDPLSPRYRYDVPKEEEEEKRSEDFCIGELKGNHPVIQHRDRSGPHFDLVTNDIDGMKRKHVHKLSRFFPQEESRRDYRATNKTDDIEGTQARDRYDMFYKRSNRQTNPLQPDYPVLESKEEKEFLSQNSVRSRASSTASRTSTAGEAQAKMRSERQQEELNNEIDAVKSLPE